MSGETNWRHFSGVRLLAVAAQMRCADRSLFMSHSRTVWSPLALARVRPSGLNRVERLKGALEQPFNTLNRRTADESAGLVCLVRRPAPRRG